MLDEGWENAFRRWYPALRPEGQPAQKAACPPESPALHSHREGEMCRYSQRRETDKGASSISSTPHSSASHHNSEVRVGLTSATRTGLPIRLSRSTKSLQLPSLSASSVMTTAQLQAESSKAVAAVILWAHRTLMPRASISVSMPGTGLVAHNTMIFLAGSSASIICPLYYRVATSSPELP